MHQRLVELKQGLPTRETPRKALHQTDSQARSPGSRSLPRATQAAREDSKQTAARTVGAHEVRVAELAQGLVLGLQDAQTTGCIQKKRHNTITRPACAPSPCSVRKHALTR